MFLSSSNSKQTEENLLNTLIAATLAYYQSSDAIDDGTQVAFYQHYIACHQFNKISKNANKNDLCLIAETAFQELSVKELDKDTLKAYFLERFKSAQPREIFGFSFEKKPSTRPRGHSIYAQEDKDDELRIGSITFGLSDS